MIIIAILLGLALVFGLGIIIAAMAVGGTAQAKRKAQRLIDEGASADPEEARRLYQRLSNLPNSMVTLEVERLCEGLAQLIRYQEAHR